MSCGAEENPLQGFENFIKNFSGIGFQALPLKKGQGSFVLDFARNSEKAYAKNKNTKFAGGTYISLLITQISKIARGYAGFG